MGHAPSLSRTCDDPPPLSVGGDRALVEQHPDELLHEVRVAVAVPDDQLAQLCRHGVDSLEQRLGEGGALGLGERGEIDSTIGVARRQRRATFEQLRACGCRDEHRVTRELGVEEVDEIERAIVGPVDVLEQNDDNRVTRQDPKHPGDGRKGTGSDLACVADDPSDVRARGPVKARQMAEYVHVGDGVVLGGAALGEQRLHRIGQPLPRRLGGVVVGGSRATRPVRRATVRTADCASAAGRGHGTSPMVGGWTATQCSNS